MRFLPRWRARQRRKEFARCWTEDFKAMSTWKPVLDITSASLAGLVTGDGREGRMSATTKNAQDSLSRVSPSYWRITFDNPPLNVMGPQFVREMREAMAVIEADEHLKVVVFDSAVEGFFLNHSDFLADFEDLKTIPPGPTG